MPPAFCRLVVKYYSVGGPFIFWVLSVISKELFVLVRPVLFQIGEFHLQVDSKVKNLVL